MSTMHNEIHVAHTPAESETLHDAGLPHVTDEVDCASCGAVIGYTLDRFVPVAIVLNDEHDWFLCLRCVAPALWPRN